MICVFAAFEEKVKNKKYKFQAALGLLTRNIKISGKPDEYNRHGVRVLVSRGQDPFTREIYTGMVNC